MNVYELRKTILEAVPAESIESAHTEREHKYRRGDNLYTSVTTKIGIIEKPYLKQWAVNQGVDHAIRGLSEIDVISKEDVSRVLEDSRTRHRDVLKRAGELGTEIHLYLEHYLDAIIDGDQKSDGGIREVVSFYEGTDPNIISALRSADEFFAEHKLIPVLSEFKVWNDTHQIAGTCDALFIKEEVYKGREGKKDCEHHFEEDCNNEKVSFCLNYGRQVESKIIIADWKSSNSIQKDDYAWQIAAYKYGLEKATGIKVDESWIIRFSKEKKEYQVLRVTDHRQAMREFAMISKLDDMLRSRGKEKLLENIVQPLVIKI